MADAKVVAKRKTKPVYAIMSVEDDNGNQIALKKENVTIHSIEKDAEAILAALESGGLPAGTFYKRIAL
tara:strand:+ start:196 stop:402 length:207 start_codon:yes stop_codon:yes gene_type:complete